MAPRLVSGIGRRNAVGMLERVGLGKIQAAAVGVPVRQLLLRVREKKKWFLTAG